MTIYTYANLPALAGTNGVGAVAFWHPTPSSLSSTSLRNEESLNKLSTRFPGHQRVEYTDSFKYKGVREVKFQYVLTTVVRFRRLLEVSRYVTFTP